MNSLTICHWNANGLSHHKTEVEYFLRSQKIDIMLVSETHFTTKNCFRIPGYTVYDTKHPSGRSIGGTAIIIKTNLKHFPLQSYSTDYFQATTIYYDSPTYKLNVSSVYCRPGFTLSEQQFLDFFSTLGTKFLAAGDFNAKHTHWGSRLISPRGRQLFNAVSTAKLDVISSSHPTYWPTDRTKIPDLIDFGVTRGIKREQISAIPIYDLSSDHSPVIIKIHGINQFSSVNSKFLNKNTNWLNYKKYISSHLPQNISLKSSYEVDSVINNFTSIMCSAVKNASEIEPANRRCSYNYPINIDNLIKQKREIRRQWQLQRSPNLKKQLATCTRQLRAALKEFRESSLKEYLSSLDPTDKTNHSLWQATQQLKCPATFESPIRLSNGDWARNYQEKANAFADHLEQVFTPNISLSTTRDLQPVCSFPMNPIKFKLPELRNIISELDVKKSPGNDKISAKMIKELPECAIRTLIFIYNAINRIGHFPQIWKQSQIIMIPKPGKDLTQTTSYRPISLLPILSKVYEKLLLNVIVPYANEKGVIPQHQFGFRRSHSTIEQVHRIVNVIRETFEVKHYCSALFIDISQAFDKVWHNGLIWKIVHTLPQNTHKILENYLSDRSFIIKAKRNFSSSRKICAGVPQGSILGPFLYLLYTADMPTNNLTKTFTFADDTAIISTHSSPVTSSYHLQAHISQLENWLDEWKIKINPLKCAHVTFSLRKENCSPIKITNVVVPQQNHVKYLGIHLDRRLTWSKHIESKLTQIKLKTLQLMWLLNSKSTLSLEYKVLIYKAIIKPIWSYGIQLWGTASASNIEKLQRRQSKILRLITGAPWYFKNSNLHKDLNIPKIFDEAREISFKYVKKLIEHPNNLARNILSSDGHRRLKRRDTLDLALA